MIKEDLMNVFQEFHSSGIINRSTNATFVCFGAIEESNS